MPKVSVIIPIYNICKYLQSTVNSVLRQTEKSLEIILVDDGSTDNSGMLCDQFSAFDHRVKVIHKKNGGLSSARNTGVKKATSEYVLFLDGDDYLADDALETLIKVADKFHPDIVQFLYKEVEETGIHKTHEVENWLTFVESRPQVLFQHLYKLGGVAASGCTKLMKRQLVLENLFESVRHEDEMWCTRVFQTSVKIVYIPDILYFYVMREGSIVHASFVPQKLDIFKVQEERIEVLTRLLLYDLAEKEYERMFLSILQLYKEAKEGNDNASCGLIKKQFVKNINAFRNSSFVKGRFRILLHLMSVNYSFVNLYLFFRK